MRQVELAAEVPHQTTGPVAARATRVLRRADREAAEPDADVGHGYFAGAEPSFSSQRSPTMRPRE